MMDSPEDNGEWGGSKVIQGPDGKIQSIGIHMQSKIGQATALKRLLYPLETACQED